MIHYTMKKITVIYRINDVGTVANRRLIYVMHRKKRND